MAYASTVPAFYEAFRDGLAAHLGALLAFQQVGVYAEPAVDDAALEWVALADTRVAKSVSGFGRGASAIEQEERYTVRGRVEVERSGATPAAASDARDRAVAILDEVETFVRADRTFGGLVRHTLLSAYEIEPIPNPAGWRYGVNFELSVVADLRT